MPTPANFVSLVTHSGTKLTVDHLREANDIRHGDLTVADSNAAAYMWSVQVQGQYPDLIDRPTRSAIVLEHVRGLVRSLNV